MKLSICACLIAGIFSATHILADDIVLPSATPESGLDDLKPEYTPFPTVIPEPIQLQRRQNVPTELGATLAPGQVPPVTVYSIYSQVGTTGVQEVFTYTQTFAPVPDQFPAPVAGVIGYGTDHANREAQPVNTVTTTQTVVMAMKTVFVTRPVQRMTEVVVVENVTLTLRNGTTMLPTAFISGNRARPSFGTALLPTAPASQQSFSRPSLGARYGW